MRFHNFYCGKVTINHSIYLEVHFHRWGTYRSSLFSLLCCFFLGVISQQVISNILNRVFRFLLFPVQIMTKLAEQVGWLFHQDMLWLGECQVCSWLTVIWQSFLGPFICNYFIKICVRFKSSLPKCHNLFNNCLNPQNKTKNDWKTEENRILTKMFVLITFLTFFSISIGLLIDFFVTYSSHF